MKTARNAARFSVGFFFGELVSYYFGVFPFLRGLSGLH